MTDKDCNELSKYFYAKFKLWAMITIVEGEFCINKIPFEKARRQHYRMGASSVATGKMYIDNLIKVPSDVLALPDMRDVVLTVNQFEMDMVCLQGEVL